MAELAQIRSGFIGLATARSADATPPGGLLEATNVCIRTENVITPRPALRLRTLPAALTTEAIGRVEFPIGDNAAGLMIDASATRWDGYDGSSGAVVTEDAANLVWNTYEGVVARRNLFLCTADALRRVTEPDADVAYRAGAPAPAISRVSVASMADSGPALAASGGQRAYRVVTRRERGDIITRSAPSNRAIAIATGTDQNATLRIDLHQNDDWAAGDVVEVYGSEETTTYPTDKLYFCQEFEVTAAHITAGYVSLLEDTLHEDLGAALYTNTSREGAESGNERPPAAGCVATFNNSLWLGDLTYPATLQLNYAEKIGATPFANDQDAPIGAYLISAVTFTNGSAVVSAVDPAEIGFVKVGMLMARDAITYNDEWSSAGQLEVVSVGATSFTLNKTWTGATGAAENAWLEDVIVIEDALGTLKYPARYVVQCMRNGDAPDLGLPATASSTCTADYVADVRTGGWFGLTRQTTLRISAMLATTAPPEVWATNGDRYTPVLPEPTVANGYPMPQDILPDHVAWSKANEPDHFPLTQIERVGDGGATVMGLGASRGAILVATDQGLWRGYGHADSGVSFSELDKDVRSLGKRCMANVGPFQYVAADRGVFECDENGAESITYDRINNLDDLFRTIALERSSALKLVANTKDKELIVCVPDDETAGQDINEWYVFNSYTRAWTRWDPPSPVLDVTIKGREQEIVATLSGVEGELAEDADGFDANPTGVSSVEVVSLSADALTATLVTAHNFGFEVGDIIQQGGSTFYVTSVASADVVTVHATGLTTGVKTARKAFECVITPSVNTLKTPHFMKVWIEGTLHWARRVGVYAYKLAFRSAITGANTAAEQTRVLALAPSSNTDARSAPSVSRFTVARAAARGTHLCFSVKIRQAGANWALEALSVRARTTADKAPARLP